MPKEIKAKVNKNPKATCKNCGVKQGDTLNLFDFKIGGAIFTLCDVCNEALLTKSLRCECFKNGRIKNGNDMRIIRSRKKIFLGL